MAMILERRKDEGQIQDSQIVASKVLQSCPVLDVHKSVRLPAKNANPKSCYGTGYQP